MSAKPKRHLSAMRQSSGSARQQQTMNRLQHSRWEQEQKDAPSWLFAVAIGFLIVVVIVGQFGG